jgi:hypothetical protein
VIGFEEVTEDDWINHLILRKEVERVREMAAKILVNIEDGVVG